MTKKLLEEGSVRSFMKLANLEPLAEEFVKENYQELEEEEELEEKAYARDDDGEPMEELAYARDDEMGDDEMGDDEMGDDEMGDEPIDEPEPEPDLDAAPAGDNEELLKSIVNAVAGVLGVEVSMDGDEGGMEMGDDELEMPPEGDEGEELPPPDEEEPVMENGLSALKTEDLVAELESRGAVTLEEEEELEEEKDEEKMQEAIEKISKRVAERLLKK